MEKAEVDQLLEESNQIYHRRASALQVECQRVKSLLMEENRIAIERYLEENPQEDIEQTIESFDGLLTHNIQAARHQCYQCIEKEFEQMQMRDFGIKMQG